MFIHKIDTLNEFCSTDIEGKVHIYVPKGMVIPKVKMFKLLIFVRIAHLTEVVKQDRKTLRTAL
jgi:hypothetical protein